MMKIIMNYLLILSLTWLFVVSKAAADRRFNGVTRASAKNPINHGQLKDLQLQRQGSPSSKDVVASGKEHHSISFYTLVINIIADLCPHGMLPLAYGFAEGGPNGVVPSVLLLALFAVMSGYSMTAFATLAHHTGSTTISEVWAKLINPKTKYLVDMAIFSLCYGCCVFYSAFAGDIFSALTSALNVRHILPFRWSTLILISSTILLPLCLTEDLSSLQVSSYLGVGGIAYTVLFHILRYFDGSYLPGAAMLKFVPLKLQPSHPSPRFPLFRMNTGLLTLANLLCVAFLAHYNSISYYEELGKGLTEYRKAVAVGFGASALVFTAMMFVGYQLFGKASLPLILNNFPFKEDRLATMARLAIGASITFAYPLMFKGLKTSMLSLLDTFYFTKPISDKQKKFTQTAVIITVLGSITGIAIKCGEEDVSIVLGIVGSVIGCLVAYCLPAFLQLKNMRDRKKAGLENNRAEVVWNHVMGILGVVFGGLGAWVTMNSAHSATHH